MRCLQQEKKRKRKYTKQGVMPITEESDSLTQSLTQHTGGWGKRWRERQHSLQSTVHNHLFSLTSLKLVSPATPPNKKTLTPQKSQKPYGVLLNIISQVGLSLKRNKIMRSIMPVLVPLSIYTLDSKSLCSQEVENRYNTWLEKWPEYAPIVLYTK